MVIDELRLQILQQFGFPPTSEQDRALTVFCQFMMDPDAHCALVVRGCAGTGKTSSREPSSGR